jgi:MFS family permease
VKTGGSNSGAAGPIRLALAGLLALAAAMGIGRFAFTPLLPMMQVDGLSVAQGGWLASANYVGYLLGALSAMRLPLGPATAIRTGLATIVLGTLAMGLTESFALWVVLRTIAGVASAWVLIFVSAWSLEKLAPLRRPLLSASAFAGVGFGIALAGLICVALMHFQVRAPQAWLVLGMMAFVLGAVVWRSFSPQAQPVSRRAGTTPSSLNWTTESVLMVLCYGAFGFGYIIPATFLPAMARQLVEDPALFGWAWPIFGLAAFISTLIVAILQNRIRNRVLWISSELVMAAGVVAPVVWPSIGAIMLAALLVGGTLVVITMVGIQEAREIGGQHASELIAAMTAAFAAGQIAGPVCVSLLADKHNGFSIALLLASGLLTLSAGALFARSRKKRKASPLADAS